MRQTRKGSYNQLDGSKNWARGTSASAVKDWRDHLLRPIASLRSVKPSWGPATWGTWGPAAFLSCTSSWRPSSVQEDPLGADGTHCSDSRKLMTFLPQRLIFDFRLSKGNGIESHATTLSGIWIICSIWRILPLCNGLELRVVFWSVLVWPYLLSQQPSGLWNTAVLGRERSGRHLLL